MQRPCGAWLNRAQDALRRSAGTNTFRRQNVKVGGDFRLARAARKTAQKKPQSGRNRASGPTGRDNPYGHNLSQAALRFMPDPSQPVIRPATHGDLPALSKLENRVFDTDRISPRSFRNFLARDTAELAIAEIDGEVAGYFVLLFRRGTGMARLYSIAVAPEHAGKGLGRRLLAGAEQSAFEHGRMALRLEVREDNAPAIELYRRSGYRPIGKYADYYEDKADALRFEKTLRGGVPVETSIPYYEQQTDFTCGPACLMMALAAMKPGYRPDPVEEIRLWREATTVFMMSGAGGCEPHGLAVAATRRGLKAEVFVSQQGALFLDTVKNEEKRMVMELAQRDFRDAARKLGIKVNRKAVTREDLQDLMARGALVLVLLSGFTMFGKKVPHWVLVHGDDGAHFLLHDPWVEDEVGETLLDAANLPVPYEQFDRMSRFGKSALRAAVALTATS